MAIDVSSGEGVAGGARLALDDAASNGKYHVLTELGRGGMAVVLAAIAKGPGGFTKLVVLKKARPELDDEPGAARTFLNEARISARMNHPNVVQVYEVYEDQGLPVMVMEYLEGQSFATLLRRHFADPASTPHLPLSVLCRTLEGLHYAHSLLDFDGRPMNLIHRDVSPQNIMVTYDGQVKLLDFGIAKLDSLRGETKTGMIKGKLGYMPAEQVEGQSLDARADLFAIGVMIWEAIAKRRMWDDQGDAAVIRRLLVDDIPRLREAVPGLDEELYRICERAVAANREDRYPSALHLLDDLQKFLQHWGGVATEYAISQWINSTCADLKTSARQHMDAKLAQFSRSSSLRPWGQDDDLALTHAMSARPLTPNGTSRRPRTNTESALVSGYTGQTLSSRGATRKRRWAWLLGAVLLASGLLLGRAALNGPAAAISSSADHRGAAAGERGAGDPASARPGASDQIRLAVSVQPASARLRLDEQPLGAAPVSQSLPRDGRVHRLMIEADGYESVVRLLTFDRDQEVNVRLRRARAAARKPTREQAAVARTERDEPVAKVARRAPRHAPAPPRPALAPAPERSTHAKAGAKDDPCGTPYAIDPSGIKRYKIECLVP